MTKPVLRAVFFDVDDTLYSTSDFVAAARTEAVRAMLAAGLRAPEELVSRELEEVIGEFGSNYPSHFDKLLNRLPAGSAPPGSPLLLVAAGMVAYNQMKNRALTPYEDAIEVMRLLKARGLALGIISAGVGIKQAEKIVRLGVHLLVPACNIHITDAAGIAKTNPKLFAMACQTAGVPPYEAAYAGDNPQADIDAPRTIGMRTFLVRRGGKYANKKPDNPPDHIIHNFWDFMDILENGYDLAAQ